MIITIKSVTEESGDYGDYRKVIGVDGDGKEITKNVGDRWKDKWGLLQENATVNFKMIQKNNKWVINDIIPVGDELPPSTKPYVTETKAAPQEIGMWWKEMGEMLRAGPPAGIDSTTPAGKLMRSAYYAQMMSVLGIEIKDKEGG